jgi:uncharacterized protein (TIGR02145 family)
VTVPPPPGAASTQTWVIGTQTWSAPLKKAQTGCTESTDFGTSNTPTTAMYRSSGLYTGSGYLYNWKCVSEQSTDLCPSPWRVPTATDLCDLDKALFNASRCVNRSDVPLSDITAKYINLWGGAYGGFATEKTVNATGYSGLYWAVWSYTSEHAYNLHFNTSGVVYPELSDLKRFGFQVRCVR